MANDTKLLSYPTSNPMSNKTSLMFKEKHGNFKTISGVRQEAVVGPLLFYSSINNLFYIAGRS